MSQDYQQIRDGYEQVRENMVKAAQRAGRKPESIRLVVVTKTQPVEAIQVVIDAGARFLGENYAEEAVQKKEALKTGSSVEWHMIGHIQGRKARLVCEHFAYVHSLDSLKLAERMERSAQELALTIPVLLEFNTSAEASKSGWTVAESSQQEAILYEVEQILQLRHLRVTGLMTMPPYDSDPQRSRVYYQRLRSLQAFLSARFPNNNFSELSMGMSGDYQVAIEEGATWIRVGTAIMGQRLSRM